VWAIHPHVHRDDTGQTKALLQSRVVMQFCHRVPASPLDSFIESIWVYQNDPRPHALERVMPTGTAQLIESLWGSRRAALGANGFSNAARSRRRSMRSKRCCRRCGAHQGRTRRLPTL